jgi:hypothetical protein
MTIMNRRNAMLGWATWTVLKRILKRNVKDDAGAAAEEAKRRLRRRKEQVVELVEPKRKKRSKKRWLALAAATAVGVATWLGTRRRESDPVV